MCRYFSYICIVNRNAILYTKRHSQYANQILMRKHIFLHRTIILFFCLFVMQEADGQKEPHVWEEIIGTMLEESDADATEWEGIYDILCDLEENPIDINTATSEDLERVPFLEDNEIADILEYIYRNGEMLSTAELSMIQSLSARKRQLLTCFIIFSKKETNRFPSIKNLLRYGDNRLLLTGNIPLYERKGDKNGYLGYKYRHSIRFEHNYGDYLRIGVVGAQDAGEPFFAGRNSAGYDFYSFYIAIKKLGRIKNLTLGRYRIRLGMGLTVNNDISMSKSMSLAAINRSGNNIRQHSSTSSYNYLQGAATTIQIAKHVDLTAFASYKDFDATLNSDDEGTIATILKSGYHRTETEMAKKNNSSQLMSGGNITFNRKGFMLGVSGYYARLNRELKPDTTQKYRRYYANGREFHNISMDYGYTSGRLSFHGETATGGCGAWATINALTVRPSQTLSLMAVQRFYSYRYYAPWAQSFSEGGSVQNESGIYVAAAWRPMRALTVDYYFDFAYFPWAKYQAQTASRSIDNMLSLSASTGKWTFGARYRVKMRQKDNADKSALIYKTDHRGRLSCLYNGSKWNIKMQLDATLSDYKERSSGYMASVSGGTTAIKRISLFIQAGYFHTDDYNSRIYCYERGMRYNFSFPAFYGEGVRYCLIAAYKPLKTLQITAKAATTDYFDRSVIGTALQQIDSSSATDIQIQLSWRF